MGWVRKIAAADLATPFLPPTLLARALFGAALLVAAESCKDANLRLEVDGAESGPTATPSAFVATPCAAQAKDDAASLHAASSPGQRHSDLVHCLRTDAGCDDQTCRRVLDAAEDGHEKATLEALVAVRRAAIELLHVISDRDRNRIRESSSDCYGQSTQAMKRVTVALGRVEDANTRLGRLQHDRSTIATIPGRAWLMQAELQVRWCTDCSPKHEGQCAEGEDSLHRAQAEMDAAGW